MKSIIAVLLTATLAVPLMSFAGPGGPGGPGGHGGPGGFAGPGGNPGMIPHGGGRQPNGWVSALPDLATTLLIGGMTYWIVNDIYYQRSGNGYVVVDRPVETTPRSMQVLDFGGKRYYVQEGHYYVREIDGHYTEVPRPAGL